MTKNGRRSIGEIAARLAELREKMAATSIYCRQMQHYQDMASERQRLLATLEALRRLEQLAR